MQRDEREIRDDKTVNVDAVPEGTDGAGENVCRRCEGSGQVGAETCPECNGSGKVWTPVGGAG